MKIILHKRPHIIRGHLLQHVEKGKPYEVVDTYQKSRKIRGVKWRYNCKSC